MLQRLGQTRKHNDVGIEKSEGKNTNIIKMETLHRRTQIPK